MPPGKGAGTGSMASVAGSSILSVATTRDKRGFTLPCIECFGCYPYRNVKSHHDLQKDNDCPKSSRPFFSTCEVIYMIMAFSI